jgi:hypothetical protein
MPLQRLPQPFLILIAVISLQSLFYFHVVSHLWSAINNVTAFAFNELLAAGCSMRVAC